MNTLFWKRSLSTLAGATALGAVVVLAVSAAPKAAITPAQAKASATARVPGKALSAKYEFEDGHWQYAVLVKDHKGRLNEVEVSAATGKVTDTEITTPGEEAREAAADKKAATKAKHAAPKGKAGEKGESNEKGESGG